MDIAFVVMAAMVVALALFVVWSRDRAGTPLRIVYDWEHALSYRLGRFERELPAGRYLVRPFSGREIYTLRKGETVDTVGLVDLTSRDKLAFRASATFVFRIVDPRLAFETFHQEKLRLDVSTALIRLAASRTLDEALSGRAALDGDLLTLLSGSRHGCEITAAAILTITLPPEIRRLASEMERARLEGLVALERARGEQAALRSLANAARLLKGNPELMNLRTLQALTSAGGRATLILHQGVLGAATPRDEGVESGPPDLSGGQ